MRKHIHLLLSEILKNTGKKFDSTTLRYYNKKR